MARQEQKVVRVGAAAHELGLHPMTVWRWIKAGRIQVIQVGRQVRVPGSEIERIVGSVDGRLLLLYGRVSGRGQLDDLATHLQRLQGWAKAERKGMETLVLSDIGSGLKAARLVQLWPYLDDFMAERAGPAWKQVVELIGAPFPHGNRQWRCEAETAGRIMRAQAARKQVFQLIQPILSDGFIRPKTSTRPAGKNRKTIKEALLALQKTLVDDETAFITMQNVVEQACNSFLEHGEFPTTYEQMQSVPLLSVGLLTYAGDDGGAKGQAYRFALDPSSGRASLLFRFPDEAGKWQWRKEKIEITLPACVTAGLKEGVAMAPTLREHVLATTRKFRDVGSSMRLAIANWPTWRLI